jgi:hypothetical protein
LKVFFLHFYLDSPSGTDLPHKHCSLLRVAHFRDTKAALTATKARGKRLGTPAPAGAVERMRVARRAQATQFAANVLPIIRDIQAAGFTSLNAIAGQLNARKVATADGGQWRQVQVRQILARSDEGNRQSAAQLSSTSRGAIAYSAKGLSR